MIKFSDDHPGEWSCTNCDAHGWASCNVEKFEREHRCEPKRVDDRRNPAGTTSREEGMRVEVRG